jgi:hypothetical protein
MADTLPSSLREHLRPCLTRCDAEEKDMLDACLLRVTLTNAPDARSLTTRPLTLMCKGCLAQPPGA